MKRASSLLAIAACFVCCAPAQKLPPRLIGSCEGCEAIFEYEDARQSAKLLTNTDTLPDFSNDGLRLMVTGTVFKSGGTAPAANIILYFYHTDQQGVYPTRGDEKGWGRQHGYLRGWVKTGPDGRYTFYTLQPGTYPSRSEPAHIHLTVLEPDGKYYWLDDFLFEGDPLLTAEKIRRITNRGGSNGILSLRREGSLLVGERDIELGKDVPGYE